MSVSPVPADPRMVDGTGMLLRTWQAFFSSVYYWLRPTGASGTTSTRPVSSSSVQLFVGQTYFDTTLGKPVWVKSLSPTVWCDATGSSV
jgi:hypothetical protein